MRQLEEQIRVLVEESSARKRKRVPGPINQSVLTPAGSLLPAQSSAGKITAYLLIILRIMLMYSVQIIGLGNIRKGH
jgi:hypothetical protein